MKVAVIGSRSFGDWQLLRSALEKYEIGEVISGGARGADSMAAQWAKEKGIPIKEFLPDYKKFGRAAPIRRNDLIVDACEMLVAFWDGESRGTKYTFDLALKKGKSVEVVNFRSKAD